MLSPIGDAQLVKVKFRSRPEVATRPILPNDSIPTESGQPTQLGQLNYWENR